MDIARPDRARALRIRRWLIGGLILVGAVGGITGLSRLEPALPSVNRSLILTGTATFGDLIRQVRGNGTLVPENLLIVSSEVAGQVVDIRVLPGAEVEADTVLIALSNPTLKQEEFEVEWQLKAAEAQLLKLEAQLRQERLVKEATVKKLESDVRVANLEAAADKQLAKEGLVPELTMQRTTAQAENLADQLALEKNQLAIFAASREAQLASQHSEIARLRATLERKQENIRQLQVRAGTSGVVQQIGPNVTALLQRGERVQAGTILAIIVQPGQLMAQIKIPETQARDVQLGLPVEIDTRNGLIPGKVSRVDPSVVGGTVTVDVKLNGALPKGARPDLSVDGIIELDFLSGTLSIPRPISTQADGPVHLFKLINDGKHAVRVPAELGKSSVTRVQVLSGLNEGDEVILSDMSSFTETDKVRLK